MGVGPSFVSGDPLAGAVRRRSPPVEARRQLDHDVGPSRSALVQVGPQLGGDLLIEHADGDHDAGILEAGHAPPCDPIIRIEDADDDPPDTGRDQRIGARGRPAVMTARFEGDHSSRADRVGSGLGQGIGFGVGAAGGVRRAGYHPPARREQDAPHPGVRVGDHPGSGRRVDGQPHGVVVEHRTGQVTRGLQAPSVGSVGALAPEELEGVRDDIEHRVEAFDRS